MTLLLALANILVAIITIGISIPLTKDKIPMNKVYGIRIPQAMVSDDNWYKINRYGAKCLIGWSIPIFLIGISLLIAQFKSIDFSNNLLAVTLFSLTPILVIGAIPQTLRWAKQNVSVQNKKIELSSSLKNCRVST